MTSHSGRSIIIENNLDDCPEKIVRKKINCELAIEGRHREPRYRKISIAIVSGAMIALALNILSIVLFSESKNSSVSWGGFDDFSRHHLTLAKPTWVDRKNQTIAQVIVLFRYGEVSPPRYTFPEDPNQDFEWEDEYEALTKKGMQRMYQLGQWIRNRYVYLNKGQYNRTNTLVTSLDDDYCIDSTQTLLAGLYPPNPEDSLFDDFLWRPLPYLALLKSELTGTSAECDELRKRENELTPKLNDKLFNMHRSFLKQLSLFTGLEGQSLNDIGQLNKLYLIYESQRAGIKALEKITRRYSRLSTIISQYYQTLLNDTTVQKFKSGPLLGEILDHMEDISESTKSKPTIILYGVNEDILMGLMKTLKLDRGNQKLMLDGWLPIPRYGASLIFELHRISHESFVKMLYLVDEKTVDINLSEACGEPCFLNELRLKNVEIIPALDWRNECNSDQPRNQKSDND